MTPQNQQAPNHEEQLIEAIHSLHETVRECLKELSVLRRETIRGVGRPSVYLDGIIEDIENRHQQID